MKLSKNRPDLTHFRKGSVSVKAPLKTSTKKLTGPTNLASSSGRICGDCLKMKACDATLTTFVNSAGLRLEFTPNLYDILMRPQPDPMRFRVYARDAIEDYLKASNEFDKPQLIELTTEDSFNFAFAIGKAAGSSWVKSGIDISKFNPDNFHVSGFSESENAEFIRGFKSIINSMPNITS